MIIKILEEMKEVRLNKDYKNYRNLSDILGEYISAEIFRMEVNQTLSETTIAKTLTVIDELNTELTFIKEIVDTSLSNKDYASLKIMAQVDSYLQKLKSKLIYFTSK